MDNPYQHSDDFVKLNLPDISEQPEYLFNEDELQFDKDINCATELMDKNISDGRCDKIAIISDKVKWSYYKLNRISSKIAHVLKDDLGLIPGNRVLLRSANSPMAVACWLAVLKAGGVVVSTMPLLRASELMTIVNKAQIKFALCDERLAEELKNTSTDYLKHLCLFDANAEKSLNSQLEKLMENKPSSFTDVKTRADDPALIAFTSGTTGDPKATIHFHRDVIAMCICVVDGLLKSNEDDIFIGSPPMAFTFGLGMLVTFPLYAGASVVLLEKPSPANLIVAIEKYNATICATAPTAYKNHDISSLKKAISSGEHLPLQVFEQWRKKTGNMIINALGSTEMIHMFISAVGDDIKPGTIGKALYGYEIAILDSENRPIGVDKKGRLAVRGPTGCRYLADERQRNYVINGWNVTGDICSIDEEGYVRFESRSDDMIISSGYNIAGPEVEDALNTNKKIFESAVIGIPDKDRGAIVKAFIVLHDRHFPSDELAIEIQKYVKRVIAPYKYPREIEFIESLPRTRTGKVQRSKLRKMQSIKLETTLCGSHQKR
jgi:2-aminobenzoate-CoA ligase